jgi:hypothetical protein
MSWVACLAAGQMRPLAGAEKAIRRGGTVLVEGRTCFDLTGGRHFLLP